MEKCLVSLHWLSSQFLRFRNHGFILSFLSSRYILIKNLGLVLSAVKQQVQHLQDYKKFPWGVSKSSLGLSRRSPDLQRALERERSTQEVLADSLSSGILSQPPHCAQGSQNREPPAGC